MDRYRSFEELNIHETEFRVVSYNRDSEVTIVAPHAGNIEPNTAEIAALIAGSDYNLFCFIGSKENSNRDLHITSHNFDHHGALELIKPASRVIAVHGCTVREPFVYLGGLDRTLIEQIGRQLKIREISCESGNRRFGGTHRNNICNRGLRKRGVQLEISRGLRDSSTAHAEIAAAVRAAILTFTS
jgi:phage replication-related protein YjqB (UPF0714/DUF867 family)